VHISKVNLTMLNATQFQTSFEDVSVRQTFEPLAHSRPVCVIVLHKLTFTYLLLIFLSFAKILP